MDEFTTLYVELLAGFLRTIDDAISTRLLRRMPTHEVTLTDELLARFDGASPLRETPDAELRFQTEVQALRLRFERPGPQGATPLDFAVEM